jgi:hypothetical protein
MLRFVNAPDEAFHHILEAFLEISIDELEDSIRNGWAAQDSLAFYSELIHQLFTPQELLEETQKLLSAHRAPALFMPTDYHFLILYEILEGNIEAHNDLVKEQGPIEYGPFAIAEIDFITIQDMYFWDTDFLLNPDDMNSLSEDDAKSLGFNEETFGVVNRLKPHRDELKFEKSREEAAWGDSLYKCGECYPYFEDVLDD